MAFDNMGNPIEENNLDPFSKEFYQKEPIGKEFSLEEQLGIKKETLEGGVGKGIENPVVEKKMFPEPIIGTNPVGKPVIKNEPVMEGGIGKGTEKPLSEIKKSEIPEREKMITVRERQYSPPIKSFNRLEPDVVIEEHIVERDGKRKDWWDEDKYKNKQVKGNVQYVKGGRINPNMVNKI